jgi:A/G-specific adenine glycosylase
VRRLFGRLFAVESETQVRAFAAQMLKAGNPADVNQALMELGATICTPRQPSCLICPAAQQCAARKAAPNQRPKPAVKKQVREVRWPLAILQRRGKILLRRRAGDGLLANLWELPGCETASTANHTALLQRELAALRIADMRPARLGEFRHSITDRRIRAAVYLFDTTLRAPLPDHRWRWIDARKLQDQPVSAMTRKAIKLYLDHETPAAQ